jgi:integrase
VSQVVREAMCAHPAQAALNQAEREGLAVINGARLVEMEPGRRPTVQPLEPAELGRLLDYMASNELGPLFETIASTGLRRGEALALRWSDVDLDVGVVHVRRQLVQLAGQQRASPATDTPASWSRRRRRRLASGRAPNGLPVLV